VVLHETAGYGKPEPRTTPMSVPRLIEPSEAVEHPLPLGGGHARTVVGHYEFRDAVVRP
jgi:hypothetical protein